jgi:hypothetical protein
MSEMGKGISMVVFVYGMAIVLGVGKACTLLIWRTLPVVQALRRQGGLLAVFPFNETLHPALRRSPSA